MADAKIEVDGDASGVQRAAAVGKAAWKDFAASLTSSVGDAAKSAVTDLASVATAAGKVSFASQHAQVRDFEAATARLAVASGRDLERVRGEYEATGKAIGRQPAAVAAWSAEVGKLSYNFKSADQSIRGIAALSAATGRQVEDYRGLAVTLTTVGRVAGDTSNALGVMASQSEQFKTSGGIAAFADQIDGLRETISHFAVASEKDFLRVTALAGALGKGLSPDAARRVQQGAFGAVASDPLRWERYLGRRIMDDRGQVENPEKVIQEIVEKTKKRYGASARRVLQLNFGAETGAALFNTDFAGVSRAAGAAPSAALGNAQRDLIGTDAGRRQVAEAELATSSRALLGSSTALGRAADALQRFSASSPVIGTMIAGTISGTLGGFLGTFGGSIAKMMGQSGKGGAVQGVIDLATKGKGGFVGGGTLAKLGVAGMITAAGVYGIEAMSEAAEERHALEEKERDSAADSALKRRVQAIRKTNVALRATKGLSGAEANEARAATQKVVQADPALAMGTDKTFAAIVAELQKGGKSQVDAERIAKAVAEGFKSVKLNVINSTGGPIEVAEQGRASAAAGNQGQG